MSAPLKGKFFFSISISSPGDENFPRRQHIKFLRNFPASDTYALSIFLRATSRPNNPWNLIDQSSSVNSWIFPMRQRKITDREKSVGIED